MLARDLASSRYIVFIAMISTFVAFVAQALYEAIVVARWHLGAFDLLPVSWKATF